MPALEIAVTLLPDLHEALLDQADKLDHQIAKADERAAVLPPSERLDRQDMDMQWIKQLRERAKGLRALAQEAVRAQLDHERAQLEAAAAVKTAAIPPT